MCGNVDCCNKCVCGNVDVVIGVCECVCVCMDMWIIVIGVCVWTCGCCNGCVWVGMCMGVVISVCL